MTKPSGRPGKTELSLKIQILVKSLHLISKKPFLEQSKEKGAKIT